MKPILFNFPTSIITKRLIIKSPEVGDGNTLNEAVVETYDLLKKTMPWAASCPTKMDSEEFVRRAAANWITKENPDIGLPMFLFDKYTQDFIGASGFHSIDWEIPRVEIGYWLRKRSMGHGYMTEALCALTHYAMDTMKVKRVEIRCDIANIRSQQLAKRAGFHLEATLKHDRIDPATNDISDTLIFVKLA